MIPFVSFSLFRYGKGFGLLQYILDENSPLIQPNPVYGAIFYTLVLLLGIPHSLMTFSLLEKCSLTFCFFFSLNRTWKLFISGQGSDVAVYHGKHRISLFGLYPIFCSWGYLCGLCFNIFCQFCAVDCEPPSHIKLETTQPRNWWANSSNRGLQQNQEESLIF